MFCEAHSKRCARKAKKNFRASAGPFSPVDFPRRPAENLRAVHRLLSIFILLAVLCAPSVAEEKKRFVLYASLLESTGVQLADGAKWMMDKGDTFPVMMYKEQHTKLLLQLAGTTFLVPAERVKVLEEKDVTPEQLATYRDNVKTYLEGRAAKWKNEEAK